MEGKGYSHLKVDDGENVGLAHKRTPILRPDGVFDATALLQRFVASSATLPPDVIAFVSAKLRDYPSHAKDT